MGRRCPNRIAPDKCSQCFDFHANENALMAILFTRLSGQEGRCRRSICTQIDLPLIAVFESEHIQGIGGRLPT
jgi:hypothetical protein